jgi:DNA-binding Lrp family transcriptional regulator
MVLNKLDRKIMAAIQGGLPLTTRPYAALADKLGITEATLLERIEAATKTGIIKRFGTVIRHHELGYHANAMVVWDVPDHEVEAVGKHLGAFDCITLCYRRPRRLPLWRYNLFTMIHGMNRETVITSLTRIRQTAGLTHIPYEILFSRRRFKQRGARYLDAPKQVANG